MYLASGFCDMWRDLIGTRKPHACAQQKPVQLDPFKLETATNPSQPSNYPHLFDSLNELQSSHSHRAMWVFLPWYDATETGDLPPSRWGRGSITNLRPETFKNVRRYCQFNVRSAWMVLTIKFHWEDEQKQTNLVYKRVRYHLLKFQTFRW